ncbi:MAG TPA: ribosome maturation factor RimM [Gaiellaceae bacterium]|nr:ribosome maturation factor RimM [Gaiellaceae bacterium]
MSERVRVGRVGKPHGLDGSFVVEQASEDARWFEPGSRLLLEGETVEVLASKIAGGRPVIRLDRKAERGAPLEVARASLPPTGADEFYVFELIGLEVVEETGRPLGKVVDVAPGVANDALELDGGAMLPLHEDCIRDIDLASRRILVARGFSDPL